MITQGQNSPENVILVGYCFLMTDIRAETIMYTKYALIIYTKYAGNTLVSSRTLLSLIAYY